MAHDHHHCECNHTRIKYCAKCRVPHCLDCGKEWVERTYGWTYTGNFPNYLGSAVKSGNVTLTSSGSTSAESFCDHGGN